MSAEDLGRSLLSEVEEIGFDEILASLNRNAVESLSTFDLPFLNDVLQILNTRQGRKLAADTYIELTSRSPTAGKTQLLYLLVAKAVLSKGLGGREACVVVLDTDDDFNVARLKQQIGYCINQRSPDLSHTDCQSHIASALTHVHILRPQSLASTITTVQSLAAYLFNSSLHQSFDRVVAFIALDSASAFYWQARADLDDAQLLAATSRDVTFRGGDQGYAQLCAALRKVMSELNCPLIFTTRQSGRTKTSEPFGIDPGSMRSSLPPGWQLTPTISLVVERTPIRKLPVETTAEEAARQVALRLNVVQGGRFQCILNKRGMDHTTSQALQHLSGFEFRITNEGIACVERSVDEGLSL